MHEAMKRLDKTIEHTGYQCQSRIPDQSYFDVFFQAFETHVAPAIPLEVETLTVLSISKNFCGLEFYKKRSIVFGKEGDDGTLIFVSRI